MSLKQIHILKGLLFILGIVITVPHSPSYVPEIPLEHNCCSDQASPAGHFDETGIEDDIDTSYSFDFLHTENYKADSMQLHLPLSLTEMVPTPPPDLA